jgi:O-antigen/teichoic acid export membrane protein
MRTTELKSKAIKGVAWSLVDKVVTQVITFALVVFLARELSPADFGLVGMLAIFIALADVLVNSGFSAALIQKKDRTEVDYATVFYVNLVVSIALYSVLYFLAPAIAEFYNSPELIDISRVLFITLVINALTLVPITKLTVELQFKSLSKVNISALVISSICGIFMVLNGFGVWSIVFQMLIKALSTMMFLFVFHQWRPKLVFSRTSFNKLFSFGSNLLIANIAATLVNNLYGLLIGRYFSAKDVGYYFQGQRLTSIISAVISTVLQGVTYPIMTSMQDDKKRLVALYKKLLNMSAFIVFPVMVGLATIADSFVIFFFTEKWLSSVEIIQWLCISGLLLPLSSLNMNILNATGRSDLFLKVDLSKLPLNFLVLIFTVPYGIEAVAMGKAFTMLVAFFINTYYPGKLYGYGAYKQITDMLPIIISTVLMAIVLTFITMNNPLLDIIFSIIVGVGVYLTSCHVLKVSSLLHIFEILKPYINSFTKQLKL